MIVNCHIEQHKGGLGLGWFVSEKCVIECAFFTFQGGFVKVRYVDYGDIASVSVSAIYYLKRKYYDLPILEVRARLANIRPAKSKWELGAKSELLNYSNNKLLVARVTGNTDLKLTVTKKKIDILFWNCLAWFRDYLVIS